MRKRQWVGSEITEDFDLRQQRLLDLVLAKVRHYYVELYQMRERDRYPLSLSRLMKLCHRSGSATLMAVRVLSLSYDVESESTPALYYDRAPSKKNPMKRPYRIFLRHRQRQRPVASEIANKPSD
ncbi:hypothetical protein [Cerasicoccus maritimus]|uniref:hypothetical protein n=1 Tax=Cerasicoccus maritimus TaxID=490089 RepID=UPI002852CACA|nr:hypothetical protein [Cerasicoccus maritimus]